MDSVMFSSKSDEWETLQALFDQLNSEFHFTLDAAALPINAKCPLFFAPADDGLSKEWNGTVWCNPPYGKTVGRWVEKAYKSSLDGTTVVMLLPARTDTRWFHDFVYGKATIRFLRGRLKFGGSKNSAPFPSMVAIFCSLNDSINAKLEQVGELRRKPIRSRKGFRGGIRM